MEIYPKIFLQNTNIGFFKGVKFQDFVGYLYNNPI